MTRLCAAIAAAFLAILMVAPASAAAMAPRYVSSEPADGEKLHQAPDRVEVTFSEPLDESSELAVEDSCGRRVDDRDVTIDGNTMSVGIELKPSGHYQVSYTATGLAGVTGSTKDGFHFMVHSGDKCGGGSGGGHNNHGGNNTGGNNNGGDNNEHNNHSGGGGQGGQHGSGSTHSGSGPTFTGGTNHTGSQTHGSGHPGSMSSTDKRHGGGRGGDHKRAKKHGKHRGHGKPKTALDQPDEPRTLASGEGQPVAPDGHAVLLALGFSLALGTLGGWFLRVSAAR